VSFSDEGSASLGEWLYDKPHDGGAPTPASSALTFG
jgi:hypothetical protein